ncbi:hypothetical protein HaLaN_03536 [Haematococcus lacustris]|uniref:Uncharacterized protein n=1 Tax=Haematococcus lacustris TaxID=44745 RepID=A0A699YNS4_HAELA|nr:hypothetical protein HaLaN_03536 [Haematococcus lacustris]
MTTRAVAAIARSDLRRVMTCGATMPAHLPGSAPICVLVQLPDCWGEEGGWVTRAGLLPGRLGAACEAHELETCVGASRDTTSRSTSACCLSYLLAIHP